MHMPCIYIENMNPAPPCYNAYTNAVPWTMACAEDSTFYDLLRVKAYMVGHPFVCKFPRTIYLRVIGNSHFVGGP